MSKQARSCCLVLAASLTWCSGCKIADFELKLKDANVAAPAQLAPLLGTQNHEQNPIGDVGNVAKRN